MIVVTGSTGHVGRLVAERLAELGVPLRLVVRDPGRAPSLPGAEVAVADYGDPEALSRALRAGDRVFMVSLHEGPERRVPLHRSFVEVAARQGVEQIVYLSFVAAGPDAVFLHATSHGATEALLRDSGVAFTSIRNGMYADDLAGWFDPDGVAREPVGEGRIAFSYRPELAEAIAVCLTEPVHDGRIYDVVGEPVTLGELARIATEVTGDPYRYEPASPDDWVERWRRMGRVDWQIEAGLSSFAAQRAGEFDVTSGDFEALTGRAPLGVGELIARLAAEMPLATGR